MKSNTQFSQPASDKQIETTVKALGEHNMITSIADTAAEAKEMVLSLLPNDAEVFTMTSQTLEQIDVLPEINDSGSYQSVRQKLNNLGEDVADRDKRALGAAPDWAIGSVQAITEDGTLLIASNTGSQLSAYVYAAGHVIWVVGAQKIVANLDEGMQRIYDYTLPLEDERAQETYGIHSAVNKILILKHEVQPNRIHVILVKEQLGY